MLNPNYDPTETKNNEPEYIDQPTSEYSDIDRMILKELVSHYDRSTHKLQTDLHWAYLVLKGQCTDELIVKLQTYDNYVRVNQDNDPIKMLNLIQRVCFNYQNDEMPVVSNYRLLQTLYIMKQQKGEPMSDFSNRFTKQLEMVEACNGNIVNDGVKNYILQKEHKQEYNTLSNEQRAKL